MKISFHKYSANGNDFILFVDQGVTPGSAWVQELCHRYFGIGADGVLTLETATAMPKMRIYNSDGAEADMCANGLRIAFSHLASLGKELRLQTRNGTYSASKENGRIVVEMSEIRGIDSVAIKAPGFARSFFVNTGVPHIVLEVASVDVEGFTDLVRPFRYYPGLKAGANVNIVATVGEQKAEVRTFERGVEGETLSCGTGLTATALALRNWYDWKGDFCLRTRGGDHLIRLGEKVYFSGDVKLSFHGEVIHE